VAQDGAASNRANPTSRDALEDTLRVSVRDSEQYAHMLHAAAAEGYAYPAINVSMGLARLSIPGCYAILAP
jgi:hypothetical protein